MVTGSGVIKRETTKSVASLPGKLGTALVLTSGSGCVSGEITVASTTSLFGSMHLTKSSWVL